DRRRAKSLRRTRCVAAGLDAGAASAPVPSARRRGASDPVAGRGGRGRGVRGPQGLFGTHHGNHHFRIPLRLSTAAAKRRTAMIIDLSDKTAIVTGSTGGIGLAIAIGLANAGARVAIVGREQQGVDAALAKLQGATGRDDASGV